MHYLIRDRYVLDGNWVFRVGGRLVPASEANDVCLAMRVGDDDAVQVPPCPDCGGRVDVAGARGPAFETEAGNAPGARACIGDGETDGGCGSTFADSRWHACARRHRCLRHPHGIGALLG